VLGRVAVAVFEGGGNLKPTPPTPLAVRYLNALTHPALERQVKLSGVVTQSGGSRISEPRGRGVERSAHSDQDR